VIAASLLSPFIMNQLNEVFPEKKKQKKVKEMIPVEKKRKYKSDCGGGGGDGDNGIVLLLLKYEYKLNDHLSITVGFNAMKNFENTIYFHCFQTNQHILLNHSQFKEFLRILSNSIATPDTSKKEYKLVKDCGDDTIKLINIGADDANDVNHHQNNNETCVKLQHDNKCIDFNLPTIVALKEIGQFLLRVSGTHNSMVNLIQLYFNQYLQYCRIKNIYLLSAEDLFMPTHYGYNQFNYTRLFFELSFYCKQIILLNLVTQ